MCGIAGIWDFNNGTSGDLLAKEVNDMAKNIKSRGPDSSGCWIDEKIGIALSHRRLAIQDLSKNGNQPFLSQSGRYVIVFNGEIYNHKLLRKDLSKYSTGNFFWKGNSDTETLLACIETWGLNSALDRFAGMFSFALWDRKKRSIYLVRDRFGEKPLYYGLKKFNNRSRKSFLFASDLSAFRALKNYQININQAAFESFINQGFISAPLTIEDDINQLSPGHYLEINYENIERLEFRSINPIKWWDPLKISQNRSELNLNNDDFAIKEVNNSLLRSVEEKKISDVPIGVFLSSGIDSSLICSLLMHSSKEPINSFTISFPDNNQGEVGFDEGPAAKLIASYLGTNHNEVALSSSDLIKLIPSLSSIYTEPFADSSQIPTYLVCREASKNGLKVVLSGDGADELFGGYNRHYLIPKIHKIFKNLPYSVRSLVSSLLINLPNKNIGLSQQKIQKLSKSILHADNLESIYNSLTCGSNDTSYLLNEEFTNCSQQKKEILPYASSIAERIMLADVQNYLHSDILVKTDRASMATGLEVRAPFLDHRVAELAWELPLSMKIRNRKTKWILKKILSNYLPNSLINNQKKGFAIPINNWLRGPLKDWACDLLSDSTIKRQGYLNSEIVSKNLTSHLSGEKDNSSRLWTLLIWQSWLSDIEL
ncbi:asparagine synthase (glutamine-hydrolyzing) [Prochlorococcus marinus]|uniref:asparagine synthase (glutamine-hydrolyzing) n=1 Tax=Prochlorococcus marinus TaxID=1219 RepID=UPI001AD9591D|nr:asparagine synthase (glutamine-hydrolyzing) [Prochlorococcus marinus]MBO8221407.1 asparagine synthase (glutamine-hydrolyzing) [Prochlorococcus marinus CUG1417]MBW3074217.1 asparagine synthase (glutamine-hydrolyzing) [Prochlorococcus marinus str. MU1417]